MTSEIRANTLKNRVGLGTVSFTNTGPVISGVTTIASGGKLSIGGVAPTELLHIADAGNPYILIEDTDANNQVGIKFKTTNYDWIAGLHGGVDSFKISQYTAFGTNDHFTINGAGNVFIEKDLDVDGHTNLDNVSVAGVTTFTGEVSITGQNLTLQGGHPNLYLTDTDHDSDFVISNSNSSFVIKDIQNNVNRIKIFTAGNTEIVGDLDIGDSIRHIGDTDTRIRFHANDTVSVETGGSQQLTIGSNVNIITGELVIPDIIRHRGDANTKIRFPADDTISFETAGSERVRITSAGFVQIGAAANAAEAPLHVTAENSQGINAIFGAKDFVTVNTYNYDDANIALQGRDADDNDTGAGIQFTVRNTANTNWLHGAITMDVSGNYIFKNGGAGTTVGTERLRITSTGMVGIGTNNVDSPLEVVGTGPSLVTIHHGDGGTNDEARIMLGALPNNPPDNRGAGIAAVNNGAGHDLIIKCSTNHSLSPSEKVRIESGGGLKFTGQGTSIPVGGILHHTNNNLYVRGGTNGLILGNNNSTTTVQIYNGYIKFETNDGSEKLRINSVGDLLLGAHGSRIFDDSSGTNVVVDIYGGTTAGKRGILALGGRTGSDDADIGTIQFVNENNSVATAANHNQSKLVSSIHVKSETSDGNAGSDSGGHLIFSTKPETGQLTERLRIESDGNIKQNLTSPSGTSPFQNSHWYDRAGGHYTLTATDHNSFTAVRTSSAGEYNNIVYKRVRMSKNCDIEFELSGNSPAGIYRHVGFVINGDGTETHSNWDRLVFRSRPANTGSNQIRIDKGGGGYGFNVESSSIPTFFDGTERHILIQLRDRLVNVIVDGEVIISQKTNADFNRSQGWFGFGIYEGGESAQITIRNLTIKNKFQRPHWLIRASGVNASVSNQNAFPFNQIILASSDMSNTSHYNTSSYRYNVPISGLYYCFLRVYRNGGSGTEVAFYVNGSVRNRFRPQPSSGDYIFAGSCLIQLFKGEYIDVRAFNGSFSHFYGNSNQQFSSWGGHLLD